MDLQSPVFSWPKHTKLLEEKANELMRINCKEAVCELKQFLGNVGKVQQCTDEELKQKVVDAEVSFDCSWSSRGWSARDGIVAKVSEDTGKVLDITYKTKSFPSCSAMEDKRAEGKVSRIQFLEWYISHESKCRLNHEGSSQVFFSFLRFLILCDIYY